ncbi:TPA: helix-turn-helix domain-containing protein [Pseudomonas aeruginosa]|uniref:helix-turn-helix domain-containing protein n=1 Tax=Pseudomonas aeruginosa TaxID=287 RepID=UPI00053D5BD3|nr:helix-turn-helix domain-containing protein [Pseudomonas aeruginosa]
MSTIIMSACWPLQGLTPAQKAVLISLADNANDEGVCWPSVAKIAERTCLSERAVQQAIKVLNECKALSIEARQGRSTMFTVTPAAFAPPQKVHPRRKCTPAASAPRTVIEPTREPSGEPSPLPTRSGPSAGEALQEACRNVWAAYRAAYEARWSVQPVRNAKVNSQVKQLVAALGAEAPAVAAFFVGLDDKFLVDSCHEFGLLLAKAGAYRTKWATAGSAPSTDWTDQVQL